MTAEQALYAALDRRGHDLAGVSPGLAAQRVAVRAALDEASARLGALPPGVERVVVEAPRDGAWRVLRAAERRLDGVGRRGAPDLHLLCFDADVVARGPGHPLVALAHGLPAWPEPPARDGALPALELDLGPCSGAATAPVAEVARVLDAWLAAAARRADGGGEGPGLSGRMSAWSPIAGRPPAGKALRAGGRGAPEQAPAPVLRASLASAAVALRALPRQLWPPALTLDLVVGSATFDDDLTAQGAASSGREALARPRGGRACERAGTPRAEPDPGEAPAASREDRARPTDRRTPASARPVRGSVSWTLAQAASSGANPSAALLPAACAGDPLAPLVLRADLGRIPPGALLAALPADDPDAVNCLRRVLDGPGLEGAPDTPGAPNAGTPAGSGAVGLAALLAALAEARPIALVGLACAAESPALRADCARALRAASPAATDAWLAAWRDGALGALLAPLETTSGDHRALCATLDARADERLGRPRDALRALTDGSLPGLRAPARLLARALDRWPRATTAALSGLLALAVVPALPGEGPRELALGAWALAVAVVLRPWAR